MSKFHPLPMALIGISLTTTVQIQSAMANLLISRIGDIAEKITVRILTPSGSGSGILIAKNGTTYQVLTARHVIDSISDGEQATLDTWDGQSHMIDVSTIRTFGDNLDIATFEFISETSYQVGELGDSTTLRRGRPVYVAGFPMATNALTIPILSFTDGAIMAVASKPLAGGYGLVYDNPTLPGMSGGVVLDEYGKIVGIHGRADANSAIATEDPNIRVKTGFNLAIPINRYLELREKISPDLRVDPQKVARANTYIKQAEQKINQKDYQGALTLCNQAIQSNPQAADAYYCRANALILVSKMSEALADFNQSVQLNPQNPKVYVARGLIYRKLGQHARGKEDLQRAATLYREQGAEDKSYAALEMMNLDNKAFW